MRSYFNSRPREGANPHPGWSEQPIPNFNSRPREGANGYMMITLTQSRKISSPAPARGRTPPQPPTRPEYPISRPAPARGRTIGAIKRDYPNVFQFPPPRGGEQHCPEPFVREPHFNSRPREGANEVRPFLAGDGPYFNSRPREGANSTARSRSSGSRISIPAPARGRTAGFFSASAIFKISIPAPARGRTRRNHF